MGLHDGAPAGKPTLPRDLRSESTHPKKLRKLADPVVRTCHRTRQTIAEQAFADIPTPRPRVGRVRAEWADLWRQPVHTKQVHAPAKKPRGKAVGGGRDPRISCA